MIFAGAVDADSAPNTRTLVISAGAGSVDFQSTVGATKRLGLIDLDASQISFAGAARGTTINLTADAMTLGGALDGTTAVNLATLTPGQVINLGTKNPGELGFTAAELAAITTPLLHIGSATVGEIDITQPVAFGSGAPVVSLISGHAVIESDTASLTAQSLRISAADVQMGGENDVTNLAAAVASGGNFAFRCVDGVKITKVDGVQGITTVGGDVTLTAVAGNIASDKSITTTAADNSGHASGDLSITISGSGNVNLTGTIDTSGVDNTTGAASAGGNVTIQAATGATAHGSVTVASINASGGNGSKAAGGAGGDVSIAAHGDAFATGGGNITITDDINASGGRKLNSTTAAGMGQPGDISLQADSRVQHQTYQYLTDHGQLSGQMDRPYGMLILGSAGNSVTLQGGEITLDGAGRSSVPAFATISAGRGDDSGHQYHDGAQ